MKAKKNNKTETKIEDILSPTEKKMYAKILKEIEKNQSFFTSNNTEEIIAYLIKNCGFSKEGIYTLFKKITDFDNKVR